MQTHLHYQVYGQRFCSNIPLSELPPASFNVKDIAFRYDPSCGAPDPAELSGPLLVRRATNLECFLSLYDTALGFLLRWEERCDFLVSHNGESIQLLPFPKTDAVWVRSAIYSSVLAFALHLRQIGSLHGSAIVTPQGAVGFLARSGSGKSTLAAAFAAFGYPFLTDDVLALREASHRYLAYPGFPYVSLSPQSASALFGVTEDAPSPAAPEEEKQRIAIEGQRLPFAQQPAPLESLYVLERDGAHTETVIEPLSQAAAVRMLLEHTNCLPLLPKETLQRHLALLARLVKTTPVYRLRYPSHFRCLPQVIAAVQRQRDQTILTLTG